MWMFSSMSVNTIGYATMLGTKLGHWLVNGLDIKSFLHMHWEIGKSGERTWSCQDWGNLSFNITWLVGNLWKTKDLLWRAKRTHSCRHHSKSNNLYGTWGPCCRNTPFWWPGENFWPGQSHLQYSTVPVCYWLCQSAPVRGRRAQGWCQGTPLTTHSPVLPSQLTFHLTSITLPSPDSVHGPDALPSLCLAHPCLTRTQSMDPPTRTQF